MTSNTLLTQDHLLQLMKKTPLNKRNIGHFCGFYIYDGECKGCNRIHTLDLDFIRQYLQDDKVKSVDCDKGAHCLHFVCKYNHKYDQKIFNSRDENERNLARLEWKKDKQKAYNIELLNGSRKPKNKEDHDFIQNNTNLVRQMNFNNEDIEDEENELMKIADNMNIEYENTLELISAKNNLAMIIQYIKSNDYNKNNNTTNTQLINDLIQIASILNNNI